MKQIEDYRYVGNTIDHAITNAIQEAASCGEIVQFEFNGVTVQVAGDSDEKFILRGWWRGMLRPSNTFVVEPYPPAELTAEQLAEDARLTQEREERQKQAEVRYQQRQQDAATLLENALRDAPPIALKDAEGWQKSIDANQDGYGGAVIRFAGDWARLMQVRISKGAKLSDVADECCSIADGPEGITGFMYGCAVSILSQAWEHGEELRRWHNLKTQIGNEGERANASGGVLNPAILSIGEAK